LKFSPYIKLLTILKSFFYGLDLKGTKKTVKDNNFDAIIKFLLEKKEKKNQVYFDIGANTGQSIKRFKKLNPLCRIHAFEPTPATFRDLEENFSKDASVKLNNLAVSNSKGKLNFFTYKHSKINSYERVDNKTKFSKSRIIASNSKEDDFEKKIEVDATTIDDYCAENNINEIDLIKIDTQGSEADILAGMKKIIENEKVSIIEIEIILGFAYEKKSSFYDYEKFLNNNNYKLIALDKAGNIISYSNYQTNLLYVKKDIFDSIRKMHEKNVSIKGITNKSDETHPFSY